MTELVRNADDLPLPEPLDYCYEWDGPYGSRKFSAALHNGLPPDRSVAIYSADQLRARDAQWRAIVAAEVARERERIAVLERLVIDAAYTLDKARIWNGMGWTYNPLHPVHYAPMRERLHNECDNIAAIRRRE